MYEQNYVITHKEPNIAFTGPTSLAIEYAFLKLGPAFNDGFERPKAAASIGRAAGGGIVREG